MPHMLFYCHYYITKYVNKTIILFLDDKQTVYIVGYLLTVRRCLLADIRWTAEMFSEHPDRSMQFSRDQNIPENIFHLKMSKYIQNERQPTSE